MHFNITLKIIKRDLHLKVIGDFGFGILSSHRVFILPKAVQSDMWRTITLQRVLASVLILIHICEYTIQCSLLCPSQCFLFWHSHVLAQSLEPFIQIFLDDWSMFFFTVFSITISVISLVIPSSVWQTRLTVFPNLKSEVLIPTCNLLVLKMALLIELQEHLKLKTRNMIVVKLKIKK